MTKPLRILHTSDWHLGRALYGRRRYAEFGAFLSWLVEVIDREGVDVLVVAGDIFDTLNPSPRTQTLYYQFLGRVATATNCGQVVVVAGNHDSPALLSAPGEILKALDIHVVGAIGDNPADEVILLKQDGRDRLIVAAVPYPRDRDLRESTAGESAEDKEIKLARAIRNHYAEVGRLAGELRDSLPKPVPVVGLGHLFAAGGQTVDGDGVRGLYVGALGQVPADVFPSAFDYLALGHLHQPQVVGGDETRRYSGAPLAMTFNEAGRPKSVVLVELEPGRSRVETLEVPVFQRLEQVQGDWEELAAGLKKLIEEEAAAWLEVEYTGQEVLGDLRERLEELTAGTGLEILRIRNSRLRARALESREVDESLEELDEDEVFRRCLAIHEVPEEQARELTGAYGEILKSLREGGGA
jgi:exonuclease SbcD